MTAVRVFYPAKRKNTEVREIALLQRDCEHAGFNKKTIDTIVNALEKGGVTVARNAYERAFDLPNTQISDGLYDAYCQRMKQGSLRSAPALFWADHAFQYASATPYFRELDKHYGSLEADMSFEGVLPRNRRLGMSTLQLDVIRGVARNSGLADPRPLTEPQFVDVARTRGFALASERLDHYHQMFKWLRLDLNRDTARPPDVKTYCASRFSPYVPQSMQELMQLPKDVQLELQGNDPAWAAELPFASKPDLHDLHPASIAESAG